MIKVAEKLRVKSDSDIKVVAIVFKHGKILATGVNSSKKSYPFLKRYFIHATLHAEIAALISIMYRDYDNLSLFVYRSKKDGSLGESKPCPMCVKSLWENGKFNKIYWTTDDGTIAQDSISNLNSHVDTMDKKNLFILNGKIKKKQQKKQQSYSTHC